MSTSKADRQEETDSMYLRTLAEFSSGTVPGAIEHYSDPSEQTPYNRPFTSKSLLASCHMKLLRAAFLFQKWKGSTQAVDSINRGEIQKKSFCLRTSPKL